MRTLTSKCVLLLALIASSVPAHAVSLWGDTKNNRPFGPRYELTARVVYPPGVLAGPLNYYDVPRMPGTETSYGIVTGDAQGVLITMELNGATGRDTKPLDRKDKAIYADIHNPESGYFEPVAEQNRQTERQKGKDEQWSGVITYWLDRKEFPIGHRVTFKTNTPFDSDPCWVKLDFTNWTLKQLAVYNGQVAQAQQGINPYAQQPQNQQDPPAAQNESDPPAQPTAATPETQTPDPPAQSPNANSSPSDPAPSTGNQQVVESQYAPVGDQSSAQLPDNPQPDPPQRTPRAIVSARPTVPKNPPKPIPVWTRIVRLKTYGSGADGQALTMRLWVNGRFVPPARTANGYTDFAVHPGDAIAIRINQEASAWDLTEYRGGNVTTIVARPRH